MLGTWRGNAEFQGAHLDLSVRFYREGDALRATLSSPDLLLLDQPLDDVQSDGRHVRFTTPDEHPLQFDGVADGDSLGGTASRSGGTGRRGDGSCRANASVSRSRVT